MKMKFIVIAVIVALVGVQCADAQKQRGGGNHQKQTEMMIKELSLNEQQAQQVTEINKKYAAKMKEMRDAAGEDRKASQKEMKQLRDAHHEELSNVLTEEQLTKFEAMQEERMAKMKERREGPRQ